MLNVYHIEKSNYVNGKGNRYVIWLQGCDLACPECWNKQTWSSKKKHMISVQGLFKDISKQKKLDGVTFSGGEPFLQAAQLAQLAMMIKQATSLNIQVFTGFEMDELRNPNQIKLKELANTIVYGRFDTNKPFNNQKVYTKLDLNEAWKFNNTDVEIDIDESGILTVTGYPTDALISSLNE